MADFSVNFDVPFNIADDVRFYVDGGDVIVRPPDDVWFQRNGDLATFTRAPTEREFFRVGEDTYFFRQPDGRHLMRPYAPR